MKTKFKFFAVLFLLFAASAWANKWTIASFDDSSDPGEPDKYVAEESRGAGLKPVSPDQVTPQSGRLYVRQKFEDLFGEEDATYQIYQGRATEEAKALGRISLEGIAYQRLLGMKLFYSRTASGDDDLENVYFDGKDIFVEGEDPVYINLNGRMEELKPMISREFVISITSDPPGATVTVGGTSRGETPLTFSVPSNKTIAAVVTKEGYYTAIRAITPSERQAVEDGVLLTARAPLVNPAAVFRTRLQAAIAAKEANTIRNIKDEAQIALRNYTANSKKTIDSIMSKFPANPPKVANEAASDFTVRQNLWTNAQGREREALNKEAQAYFNELREFVAEADAAVAEVDFSLRYEYIPNSAISFSTFSVNGFTASAEVDNSRVNFKAANTRVSYGTVPRRDIESNNENVHGVLKIWDTPNENEKYASFYDVAFFYGETPLPIQNKGVFSSKNATAASRAAEKDLNARIAKYSGKAAWDQKDREATLEALRRGEVSDRPAAPVAAYDEYEYDEDEDEDEYDDGLAEQDKYDYSRYGAVSSATDVFGHRDEYLFWAGVAFAAVAVGAGVVGFLENMSWSDANKALDNTKGAIEETKNEIRKRCTSEGVFDQSCFDMAVAYSERQDAINSDDQEVNALYKLNQIKKTNEKTKDSYNTSRIIWFSAAGLSAAISITLFTW